MTMSRRQTIGNANAAGNYLAASAPLDCQAGSGGSLSGHGQRPRDKP
jgi:hypothetical protein